MRKTLGFQTPASKLQQVLRRPSEPAAVIGKKKSWYGTFPVTRLTRHWLLHAKTKATFSA